MYKKRLSAHIGHIQLKNLLPAAINKAYSDLLSEGVTKNFVHELHVFMHNVLGMALHENIIPRNYADAASPPKFERKKVAAIEENALAEFFNALYDKADYMKQVFFSVMLAAGCRIGELCALTWDNVDFENGCIHICRHFVKTETREIIADGCKTAAGDRWIYMDENIMDMLREYRSFFLKTAKEYGSKWNYGSNAVFFSRSPNNLGNYITPCGMRTWLTSFLKDNSLKHISPHQFRHTAISLQLQAGVSVPDVAKRAGHSNGNVTLSVYAHTLKNNDKHLCEVVTKALPKLPKPAAS